MTTLETGRQRAEELVLRAGCVETAGRTVIVSGAAGSGVSTLLAALVAEGCTYLSDDTVAVEQQSGRVRPFPQPLMLDDRSLEMVPVVTALRSVSVVLFPERDDSGLTALEPVTFDDAVIRLAESAYNFPGHEQETIEAIHWLVRRAVAFCVVGRDPHDAARAVLEAMAERRLVAAPSSSSGHRMCPGAGRPPV